MKHRLTLQRVLYREADDYYMKRGRNIGYIFAAKTFERITGIEIKPGEVREIESIKIKLKPVRAREKK